MNDSQTMLCCLCDKGSEEQAICIAANDIGLLALPLCRKHAVVVGFKAGTEIRLLKDVPMQLKEEIMWEQREQ